MVAESSMEDHQVSIIVFSAHSTQLSFIPKLDQSLEFFNVVPVRK